MKPENTQKQGYKNAQKRVKDLKGFYIHLTIYCLVISVLTFINLKFEPHFHRFWFSALGWGIGLLSHWLKVFGFNLFSFGKNWEEKRIKQIIEK
jgi:hypothetical protein